MPKEKTSDLKKLAKKNGWWKLREGGDHEIWTNGEELEEIKRSPLTPYGLFQKLKKKFVKFPGKKKR